MSLPSTKSGACSGSISAKIAGKDSLIDVISILVKLDVKLFTIEIFTSISFSEIKGINKIPTTSTIAENSIE